MNGVENLYFAPEVSMTNNFNGLTYDEAAEQISELVLDKLDDMVLAGGGGIQQSP